MDINCGGSSFNLPKVQWVAFHVPNKGLPIVLATFNACLPAIYRLSATLVRWLSPRAVLSPYRLGMRIIHPRVCCATANMGMERIELSMQALKVLCHTTWLHPHIMRRFAPALG